jgi:hypothetical protein
VPSAIWADNLFPVFRTGTSFRPLDPNLVVLLSSKADALRKVGTAEFTARAAPPELAPVDKLLCMMQKGTFAQLRNVAYVHSFVRLSFCDT